MNAHEVFNEDGYSSWERYAKEKKRQRFREMKHNNDDVECRDFRGEDENFRLLFSGLENARRSSSV